MSTVTLDQFRADFTNGGYRSIVVTASGGLFYVTAQPREGTRVTLATSARQAQGFRDAGTAIALLHEIGARQIEVNTSDWDPQGALLDPETRTNIVAHDRWFRAEVEQALREADDPHVARIPQEKVTSNWAAQRAELVKRARTSS